MYHGDAGNSLQFVKRRRYHDGKVSGSGMGAVRAVSYTHLRGKTPEVEAMEGAGVGLYLVREIMEAQGGSVRALPSHRGGTIFQMMLPKKKYSLE